MINFPVFTDLRVDHYALFPGSKGNGLELEFKPGLTMILGANGLGKTTLVSLMYRMCAGPYDIKGLSQGGDLGGRKLDATKISRPGLRYFADRVVDGAEDAVATLEFELGDRRIAVTRSLARLNLLSAEVDGQPLDGTEKTLHEAILKASGLSSLGDWILLLRYIVFYFEDRRALVWDPSAQSQILGLLFLQPKNSQAIRAREREILELDSAMRNLRAIVGREEQALVEAVESFSDTDSVRSEVEALEKILEVDLPKLDGMNEELEGLERDRKAARVRALQAEADLDSARRDLEHSQLEVVAASFPPADETARYIIGHLFSEAECLACGSAAAETASELETRVSRGECVVCGTQLKAPETDPQAIAKRTRAEKNKVEKSLAHMHATQTARADAEAAFDELLSQIQELTAEVASRHTRLSELMKQLPPEESELKEQRSELSRLQTRVQMQQRELERLRDDHADTVSRALNKIARRGAQIKEQFDDYASGFLFEDCQLIWSPHRRRIGEGGSPFDFPAFELDMTGASFDSAVRRTGPDQVSESQREFIDLAFRMALMAVAAKAPGGTLVIDAPESSLDAVFVSRAAEVLSRFGSSKSNNRLAVTSNLVEGNLIPGLLRRSRIASRRSGRVLDLLEVAEPTAATTTLAEEYAAAMDELFERAKGS